MRYIPYVFILVGLLWAVSPARAGQCLSGNCTSGQGVFLGDDFSRYEGAFQDGRAHGRGVLVYPVGSRYQGEFSKGHPHGRGVYEDWRGGRHDGCFFLGWEHGNGTHTDADGARYDGFYNRGFRDGPGVFVGADGRVQYELWLHGDFVQTLSRSQYRKAVAAYEAERHEEPELPWNPLHPAGCVRGDCQDGFGVFVFENGQRFEGPFRNGKGQGRGRRTYPNGDVYVGHEHRGIRHGHGVYYFRDGQKFEGEFVNDRREGLGTFTYEDGSRFIGVYRGDRRNGPGQYISTDGDIRYGMWRDGEFLGPIGRKEFEEQVY